MKHSTTFIDTLYLFYLLYISKPYFKKICILIAKISLLIFAALFTLLYKTTGEGAGF